MNWLSLFICSFVLFPWQVSQEALESEKKLIAHRGASAYAPEHTLEAYRLAISQGADYVEQDLHVSRDGILVCIHDRYLERTANVEKVFPDRFRSVREGNQETKHWLTVDFTLEELKQLDAGSWFSEEFSGLRIPTFQEAIDLIRGNAGLYPELKDVDFYRQEGFRIESLLVDILKKNNLFDQKGDSKTPIVIQSFSEDALRRMRFELECRLPLVFLFGDLEREQGMSPSRLKEIKQFATGIGPNKQLLLEDLHLTKRAHAAGLTVTPYTFRSTSVPKPFSGVQSEMRHFLYEVGVDALFTDNPDLFPRAR